MFDYTCDDFSASRIVDICIKRVLKQRGNPLPPSLNPEDVFFREVSRVEELAWALQDYETEQLGSGITTRQSSQLIVIINSLLQVEFHICDPLSQKP